ncbi:uncharacterized protein [Diadema antillarum]|uniref:uncharacterized protein n=1 Tax=Diadema antillarum TaxID=105358 RepID=UPI003A86671D
MSSPKLDSKSHCCRHHHGKLDGTVSALRPRSSRSALSSRVVSRRQKTKSSKTKSSSGRKRLASSPEGSSHSLSAQGRLLKDLISSSETSPRRDATSPTHLNFGRISLADERGDASDALFIRRKSPRQDVSKPTFARSAARPKTASPNRSPNRSLSPQSRRAKSSMASPTIIVSPPQQHTDVNRRRSILDRSTSDDRRESHAWSMTEVLDDDTCSSDMRDEEFETPESLATTSISKEEEEEQEEEERRVLKDPIRDMMATPPDEEDGYDTDLAEEFPPKPRIPRDASGRQVYIQKCREEGIDPATYVLRHLTDPAFQLRHRYLNLQNVLPLTIAMKSNSMIETLDMSDNHLEEESGVAIAKMLEDNINITKVDLSQNLIRAKGITAFSNMLETNYTLKTLCLQSNHLTDKDAIPLAEALKNNATLTELDLSHNDLGELAGVYLGAGLTVNDGLMYLDLKWNAVRNKGIAAISNALKVNSSLEVLDLSHNGVSVPGCIALMRALKINMGLRILDLSYNHVNSVGAQKLSIGVKKNTRLEGLLLTSNPIGDDGMVALCKAMKLNPTLILVSIQNIPMPLIVHQKIRDVQEMKDIHVLKLDVDGHKRNTPPSHVVALVDKFICDNQSRILNHCLAQDVDHTGTLDVGQVQKVLWESGLDVTKEQLDTALQQTKLIRHRNIPYRPMLDGLSALMMRTSWKAPSLSHVT